MLKYMLATRKVEEETGRDILPPLPKKYLFQVSKEKYTRRELKMTTELDGYDMDGVILYLGFEVNIFPRKSWEMMDKTNFFCSPIQLWLDNQYNIYPIGRLSSIEHIRGEYEG